MPIDFNNTGVLNNPNGAGNPYNLTIDMAAAPGYTVANGAQQLQITWNLLDSLLQPSLTNFATDSSVTDLFQDGSPPAQLTSISVADGGRINGLYSDGRALTLAQLALARFNESPDAAFDRQQQFRAYFRVGSARDRPGEHGRPRLCARPVSGVLERGHRSGVYSPG